MATFDDFKKIELRVGKILEADRVDGSDKLLKLRVDFGLSTSSGQGVSVSSGQGPVPVAEKSMAEKITEIPVEPPRIYRQILAGIGKSYAPADIIGKSAVFIVNLEPRMIMGLESQGMILAASTAEGPAFLAPNKAAEPGASIS